MTSVRSVTESVLEVPEPNLTAEEIVARARAMHDRIRDERAASARRGHYSAEIHREFQDAGFYRILQPRIYGGYEFGPRTFFDVVRELSRADAGTGWCYALGHDHVPPLVSHFSAKVVREAFGDDGTFISPHSGAPRGTAIAVEGGYVINGQWAYASGVPFSTHAMVTALLDEGGQNRRMVALVPRKDYEILDDWGDGQTIALGATGSNSIRLRDVFVPAERFVPYDWDLRTFSEGTPGYESTANTFYLGNNLPLYGGTMLSMNLGIVLGMVDEYEKMISTKVRVHPPQVLQYLHPTTQIAFGEILARVDAVQAIVASTAEQYVELAERTFSSNPPELQDYRRLANMCWWSARLTWEAGELMARRSGGSVARTGHRIFDHFVSMQIQRAQVIPAHENMASLTTRGHFGLDSSIGYSQLVGPQQAREESP